MSERTPPLNLVLLLLCAAQFMLVLDVAIVNVALPSIQRDLGVSGADLQWVSTAYAVTFGGLLVLAGRLGDVLGKRRVFAAGLLLFTLASALCGAAHEGWQLFAARGLQGVGAAAVASAALALLTAAFPDGAPRARAIGVFGAIGSLGAAAGQVFGGVLTDLVDWRAIFLVNVPVGIAGLALTPRLLRETQRVGHERLDLVGSLTLTLGLATLILGLTGTASGGVDGEVVGLLAAATALLALFSVVERRHPRPLVDFSLFRIRAVAVGNLAMALSAGAITAVMFFATLYLQLVLGYGPLTVALAFAPITLVIALLSPRAAALALRVGVRRLLLGGTVLAAAGTALLAFVPDRGSYAADVLPGILLVALGMAAFFAPAMLAATTDVPERQQGLAAGAIGTSQQLGGAVGLAIAATIAADAATVSSASSGYRAGFLAVLGLLAIAAVASAFAPGPQASSRRTAPAPAEP